MTQTFPMIRAIAAILLFAALSISVESRSSSPPPYPTVFSAAINTTEYRHLRTGGYVPTSPRTDGLTYVFFDAPNKRVKMNYINNLKLNETWSMMYQMPGAKPGTPNAHGFTILDVNPEYLNGDLEHCYYGDRISGLAYSPPFPDHWDDGGSSDIDMSSWVEIPDDMVYNGTYYIEELNVNTDRWDSKSVCHLDNPFGDVPCFSIMYSQGPNPVPLMDMKAYPSDEEYPPSMYTMRVYHSLKTSVSDSDFQVLNNWQTICINLVYDLHISWPGIGTYAPNYAMLSEEYPSKFMVSLRSQPLGPVTIAVNIHPTNRYNCNDCLQNLPHVLTFTEANWNVPQIIPLIVAQYGCSLVSFNTKGGGYGLRDNPIYVGVLSCPTAMCDFYTVCPDPQLV